MVFGRFNSCPLSGPGSIASTKVYYRCVRNLGLAKNASENDHPEDFVTYDAANRTITLTNPRHHIRYEVAGTAMDTSAFQLLYAKQ